MLIGDMAIKNLAPKDANSGGRIIKNMRICGSGLYEYHKSEAALMGLPDADKYVTGDTFKVYRPADVLVANKDLYARVPIITGHHVRVNTANAKQLAVGMVGDTVQSEVGADGETYLYTTGTIIAGDGIEAYEKYGELSVGYDPIIEWCAGDYKGEHYEAMLKGFNEINHLLICPVARGGHQCRVMDECPWGMKILGGKEMGFFAKILGRASKGEEKPMGGDAAVVSALLQGVAAGADSEVLIGAVREIVGDCKDATWNAYLDEMKGASKSGADKDTVGRAVRVVEAYYREHIAGDEEACPECGKTPCVCDEKKPADADDKKADADNEKKPADADDKKVAGDEAVKKMVGDAVEAAIKAIDFDKLISAHLPKPSEPNGGDVEMSGDTVKEGSSDDIIAALYS